MQIGHQAIYETIRQFLEETRNSMLVLTGPRQVGKTTLITHLLKSLNTPSLYTQASEAAGQSTQWISEKWQTARLQLNNTKATEFILVIDEVQRIEGWSKTIKEEWDYDTRNKINLKMVILGSSRLQLINWINEGLKKQTTIIHVPHWSFTQMQETFDFSLEQYLWFGGYPGAAKKIKNEKNWRNYLLNTLIEPSISKDVYMTGRIDKPAMLHRLFEIGCRYSGQIVSLTKILRQLQNGGNTTTLANYIKLLDSAGILTALNKSSLKSESQRASIPKLQVYNNGLTNALKPIKFKSALLNPIQWGHVCESAIGAHLVNHAISENYRVEYWRDRNAEVDYVVQYKDKKIGIEIKNKVMPKTSGAKLFTQELNPYKMLSIGDKGIPISEFLKMNPIDMFV